MYSTQYSFACWSPMHISSSIEKGSLKLSASAKAVRITKGSFSKFRSCLKAGFWLLKNTETHLKIVLRLTYLCLVWFMNIIELFLTCDKIQLYANKTWISLYRYSMMFFIQIEFKFTFWMNNKLALSDMKEEFYMTCLYVCS